tara:strand:- start:772 stop:1029 length:258 start_codon:yes stop_codon:yes gene_type:complete
MKLLFENWRKLLEGEVIDFPMQPKLTDEDDDDEKEDLQYTIRLEEEIAQRLANLHGNMASIPPEKIEQLEQIMMDLDKNIEELLK